MASKVKNELASVAREYWNIYSRPILLSALGGRLSVEAKAERSQSKETLATFIREHMRGELRWLTANEHGGAVLPVEAAEGRPDDELERLIPAPVRKTAAVPPIRNPVVHSKLWELFRDGMPGRSRLAIELSHDGPPRFRELAEGEDPASGWFEVTPEDIAVPEGGTTRPSAALVGAAVRVWAAKHGIALHLVQSDPPSAKSVGQQRPSQLSGSNDLARLLSGMSVLRESELSKIYIPADVIMNLISRNLAR